jgi:hypothetical protein
MQVIELLTSDVEIAPEMQAELLNELKSMSRNTYYLLRICSTVAFAAK